MRVYWISILVLLIGGTKMEDVVFKIYKLELSTGVIAETNREFESALDVKDKCFELKVNTIDNQNNIR